MKYRTPQEEQRRLEKRCEFYACIIQIVVSVITTYVVLSLLRK